MNKILRFLAMLTVILLCQNAYAEIEFHCKEKADSARIFCKFAILKQGAFDADIKFTIKQGDVRKISSSFLGRKFCFERGFNIDDALPDVKPCEPVFRLPIVQERNLDEYREIELKAGEKRLLCISGGFIKDFKSGCWFTSQQMGIFLKPAQQRIVENLPDEVELCNLTTDKPAAQPTFAQCVASPESRRFKAGKSNLLDRVLDEPSFEQLIAKEPPRNTFSKYTKEWFEAVSGCVSTEPIPPNPAIIFLFFFDKDRRLMTTFSGIPTALEVAAINLFCKDKWRVQNHSKPDEPDSAIFDNASPATNPSVKSNEELIEAIESARDQLFNLQNSLRLKVKVQRVNYLIYQEIYADVGVFDINGSQTNADKIYIKLKEYSGGKEEVCYGKSFCAPGTIKNYGTVTPDKFICVAVEATKNGVTSSAFLQLQPGTADCL